MRSFHSQLQYVPGRFDLTDLIIEDQSGSLKAAAGAIVADQKGEQWTFSFPRFSIKNFRPAFLKKKGDGRPENPKWRSLVIKKLEVQQFEGVVDALPTWTAQGSLQFSTLSQKHPLQVLFAVPAEIILRLGLNPHVLNPVAGEVTFSLQGDRVYLQRFRNVFSEGRGSKFYLVGPDPSWIDFDGNLSLNVRMKHFNLMFKITELFTVAVQGNITKPRYFLQRQPRPFKNKKKYKENSDGGSSWAGVWGEELPK